jgi:rhamnosyltransferase
MQVNLSNIKTNEKERSELPGFTVDLIIPVYKPDKKFFLLMERITKQSMKPGRIILLHTIENYENGSQFLSDIQKYKDFNGNIMCIDINKADFDHGGTRNYGAALSDADLIMFMTQDAVPADRDLILHLIEPFKDDKVAAAYGRQLSRQNAGTIESYTRTFNYPEQSSVKSQKDIQSLGIKAYFCSNVCAVYRKAVYDKLGGFVTKTIFNEDMIMAAGIINAGYSIAYTAHALVIHSHRYTYRQQFTRNFDLAVSQQQYKQIFGTVKSETEGKKLVLQTFQYLLKEGKFYLVPDLIFQSAFKYLGYKVGRKYEVLPKVLIKKLSMNPGYWD